MVYKPNTLKKHRGFTLIELIVVIVIMGILAGLITPNFINALKRGRDSRRRQNLKKIQTALRAFYNDNQAYPDDNTAGEITNQVTGGTTISWGGDFESADGSIEYMAPLPEETKDPQYYYDRTDDDSYLLEACLENPEDDDPACTNISDCPSGHCFQVTQ